MQPRRAPVHRYVLALRRDRRRDAPADWIDQVRAVDGVEVETSTNSHRILIKASAPGVERIRQALSDYLHIEELISHHIA